MHRELGDAGGILSITPENLRTWCGKPSRKERAMPAVLPVGVVPILSVSSSGGHVDLVEVKIGHHQTRKIKETGIRASGQSKETVNKIDESLQIAFGILATDDGILEENVRKLEKEKGPLYVQGHLTDGAPKDGPSAGVAITLALYGAMTKQSVRRTAETPLLAATGEISLSGSVTAVGGVRDKVLAAHRFGVRVIILPKENEDDTEDIPDDVKAAMRFELVSTVYDALAIAYPDDKKIKSLRQGSK